MIFIEQRIHSECFEQQLLSTFFVEQWVFCSFFSPCVDFSEILKSFPIITKSQIKTNSKKIDKQLRFFDCEKWNEIAKKTIQKNLVDLWVQNFLTDVPNEDFWYEKCVLLFVNVWHRNEWTCEMLSLPLFSSLHSSSESEVDSYKHVQKFHSNFM